MAEKEQPQWTENVAALTLNIRHAGVDIASCADHIVSWLTADTPVLVDLSHHDKHGNQINVDISQHRQDQP